MKKVVIVFFLILVVFISSCNNGSNNGDNSGVFLSGKAGDISFKFRSYPPVDKIESDIPISLVLNLANGAKDEVSGVIEIRDNVADSAGYGGIIGTYKTDFSLEGIEDGQKPQEVSIPLGEVSNIIYNNAQDLKSATISLVIKTSKSKEIVSESFCLKKNIADNTISGGCTSHPRINFLDKSSSIKIKDLEYFASRTDNLVNKINLKMSIEESSNCNIISEDLGNVEQDEIDSNNLIYADAALSLNGDTLNCNVQDGSLVNQKIIICDNTGDLVISDQYYDESITAKVRYGCSYLYTTNINLLKKEA